MGPYHSHPLHVEDCCGSSGYFRSLIRGCYSEHL
jgi:hypothetical protein